MSNLVRAGKLFVLFFVAAMGLAFVNAHLAAATERTQSSSPDPSVIALEIEPVCSDAAAKVSRWKVTNKNDFNVAINWNNFENGLQGSYEAAPGGSQMTTGYVESDPNNTTKFVWAGHETQTNAQVNPCKPEQPAPVGCIDGRIQQNLNVAWLAKNTVTVNTVDGKPLCEDVAIYFSSYIMPDHYDGSGFEDNPTAYPQHIYSSASAILKKDTDGSAILTIALPDACKNVQVDVYYAPEIRTVGANGHGTQNIVSDIYEKTGLCGKPGQGGGNGGEPTDPVTPPANPQPTAPVSEPVKIGGVGAGIPEKDENRPVAAKELPNTGSEASLSGLHLLLAALLGYAGYVVTNRLYRRTAEIS